MTRPIVFALLSVLSACGGARVGSDLPVATLACPESAEPGVPFTVSGTASGPVVTTTLRLGAVEKDGLDGEFVVTEPGFALVELTVADAAENRAVASCVVPVGAVGEGAGANVVDITGTFAFVAYDRAQLQGGALEPPTQCAPAPSLAVVELAQEVGDRADVTMTMTWCQLEMPDVDVRTFGLQDGEIPDTTTAMFAPLGPATFPFDGVSFSPPMEVFGRARVLGADLTNPDGDALPTSIFDETVSDPDEDGNDGVPIFVNETQLNVAMRRTVRALSGTVSSADQIDGSVEGSFHADTEISLLDPTGIMQANAPTGIALPSSFQMTRVEAGATCTTLVAQREALLAALPAPSPPAGCHVAQQN